MVPSCTGASCGQIYLQDSYLVGQQQVPDLSQILLGEDKAHISFNVGQEPVKTQDLLHMCEQMDKNFHKNKSY